MDSENQRKERIDSQVTFRNETISEDETGSEKGENLDYFERAGTGWIMKNGAYFSGLKELISCITRMIEPV
jgi:hypothetical protein